MTTLKNSQLEAEVQRARAIMLKYGPQDAIKNANGNEITEDTVRLGAIKSYFSELVANARKDYLDADEVADYREKVVYKKERAINSIEDSKTTAKLETHELRLSAIELRYQFDRLSMLRDDLGDLSTSLQSRNKHLVEESRDSKIKGNT